MKYMGSKNRHSRDLLNIILANRKDGQAYVEPFVGGANLIDKVPGIRIASDIDSDLISLWRAVSTGWLPPKIVTEQEYHSIKTGPTCPLKGYAAFALSYGGKKFGGWCRDSANKRDYVSEAYRNAIKQFPKLVGVDFRLSSYVDLVIPENSIIYCDPPYEGTTRYATQFNHAEFWEWCRLMSKAHEVYISEYNAPDDFVCVWEKEVKSSLTSNTGAKINTERLFKLNSINV